MKPGFRYSDEVKSNFISRVTGGEDIGTVCDSMNIGRQTADKWYAAYKTQGPGWLNKGSGAVDFTTYAKGSSATVENAYHLLVRTEQSEPGFISSLQSRLLSAPIAGTIAKRNTRSSGKIHSTAA